MTLLRRALAALLRPLLTLLLVTLPRWWRHAFVSATAGDARGWRARQAYDGASEASIHEAATHAVAAQVLRELEREVHEWITCSSARRLGSTHARPATWKPYACRHADREQSAARPSGPAEARLVTVPIIPTHGFYTTTESGELCCRVCLGLKTTHDPQCAVIAMRVQLQELSGALGLYVAEVRETLDTLDHLLHGKETP